MIRLKVKEVAQRKGISQRKLSMRSGVDIKTVQKIYRYPTSVVNTETLDKFAKVLEVDVRELLESVPDEVQYRAFRKSPMSESGDKQGDRKGTPLP